MQTLGSNRLGWVCLAVALAGTVADGGVLPPGVKIEKILAHSADLAALAQSPTGELWLLERGTGEIKIVDAGVFTQTLTLDVDPACEGGLLGIAFPDGYPTPRTAYVSYRATTGALCIDAVTRGPHALVREGTVVCVEEGSAGSCRAGGGLAIDQADRLYLGVGDFENPASSQDGSSLLGKILRWELDGSIPPDNPDPTSPIFAMGLRDPRVLAINPISTASGETLYVGDSGSINAADEINVVLADGNYGWNVVSGESGTFDDPLTSVTPGTGIRSLTVAANGGFLTTGVDGNETGSLIYARQGTDRLEQVFLSDPAPSSPGVSAMLFNPDGDTDGSPDSGCPHDIDSVLGADDGMLYAGSNTGNPGIWRIYSDGPGPREVSPPGSPFPLLLDKTREAAGADLLVAWEHLGPLDTGRPARHGGQHAEDYQIWEGNLPLDSSGYDHAALLGSDGTRDGPARRTATITSGDGDRYYLVTAQGDNLEGPGGHASNGTPREVTTTDYCEAIGIGRFTGHCIDDFRNPLTGQPTKLIDYNPLSATYLQPVSIRDYRGHVVHLDISADNCFWCNLQAPTFHAVDLEYRARDFILITVLNASLLGPVPFAAEECEAKVADWSIRHNEHSPVVCDTDLDGDGLGDISRQYVHLANEPEPCGGTPQNFFIDPGGSIYAFTCSYTPGPEVVELIAPEVNPESCE